MNRLINLLLLCMLGITSAIAASDLPKPEVVKVNERVYALLGPLGLPSPENQGYMVNSAVIIGKTGVILVDTGFTDEIGRHLNKTIQGITDKPVRHIINTHHHGDHVLGNVAFGKTDITSSEKARELVETTGAEWVGIVENAVGRKFPNTKPVPATQTYPGPGRTEKTIDGVKMVFIVPKGSHTPGDLMVYLPEDKVLIAGDVMVNDIVPNFRDANAKNWIATLDEAQKLPARTIIPGHGPLARPADLTAMHARMASLYEGVEAGYKEGLTDTEIRQKLDLSDWKKLKNFDEQMGPTINRIYLEVEAANF
ncbi:MBL fold metallo-hydrolase [Thermithiobacillus plumbiphilus]|uniref:MBL fold metallo-hydrolase n=1 Tax=Thermithiobacillus plumbiphilus TaxID=1729899 RepID=A0ABU9DE19_9PROT